MNRLSPSPICPPSTALVRVQRAHFFPHRASGGGEPSQVRTNLQHPGGTLGVIECLGAQTRALRMMRSRFFNLPQSGVSGRSGVGVSAEAASVSAGSQAGAFEMAPIRCGIPCKFAVRTGDSPLSNQV